MSEKKLRWTRPQLIVLGRGQPEESVLKQCKNQQFSSTQGPAGKTSCQITPALNCRANGQT